MFFTIANNQYTTVERLRTETLLRAYHTIKIYPLKATEKTLDLYINQQYKVSLKNMCIKLLLNLTFYNDSKGNLVLIFKNPKYDAIARLITYGNGVIPGSRILKIALHS